MIYLDNAATTKPVKDISRLYADYSESGWFNPSALYSPALSVEKEMESSRSVIKSVINAPDMIFTSCGTESANTVIFNGWRRKGKEKFHFITSSYEHPCVYEAFRHLEELGHDVTYVAPGKKGYIDEEDLVKEIRPDTALVAIMHVNNETGAINDITSLSRAVKKANPDTLFFSDGVQGFLHVPFDMKNSMVDYYSASAHKIHGLKGTGALFFRHDSPLREYIYGGGQERNLRSGTENTFGIFVFQKAVSDHLSRNEEISRHLSELKEKCVSSLMKIKGAYLISPERSSDHIINIAFEGVRGEVLLHLLEQNNIYVSTGSACSSKKRTYRIHDSVGVPHNIAECVIRISFSDENTMEEIDELCKVTEMAVERFSRYSRR